jgi:hypothetical protein
MILKIAKPRGVSVTLNQLEANRLLAASELADRIAMLPCVQAEQAKLARDAVEVLIGALKDK